MGLNISSKQVVSLSTQRQNLSRFSLGKKFRVCAKDIQCHERLSIGGIFLKKHLNFLCFLCAGALLLKREEFVSAQRSAEVRAGGKLKRKK